MDTSIHAHFSVLVDPRVDRRRRHKLSDILVIALSAVICGAEHFTEMEAFGKAKEARFRTFLELPNGIPSHDTFGRVPSLLDPAMHAGFANPTRDLVNGFAPTDDITSPGSRRRARARWRHG
jgi:hypothetical protein